MHQENVILENLPKEKILGKLSEEEAKAGTVTSTFTPPAIDSILNLYDLEQVCISSLNLYSCLFRLSIPLLGVFLVVRWNNS